ncbi:LytR/AlgR family response regulator transcription factor [Pedobacter miscanthi]|uniref:DNA-binding response regulator n=1 Tax=Pedobacter miscanthi TaxID=2259170 RepID=A0A366L603_9SPHI|nr:LytTR family DNA-binding domain-containing protein [Pedobacter miscanthi]RBQ08919.1 DNA-binding response regulator [Pedobacter miscanthi]
MTGTNKKYNCLIVDDEPPAREVLQRYISRVPMLHMEAACGNAIQAAMILKQQDIDILFLDIQMPQLSGLELIGTLLNPPKIILTTAFEQYAIKAFELGVSDYLLKPIQFERFLKAVMKVLPEQHPKPQSNPLSSVGLNTPFLYFRAERKMVKVQLDEIEYIESLKDYVKIHTTKGTVITKYAMASLEAMLSTTTFIRVHRSYLVAISRIDSYTPEDIYIASKVIPIGKKYQMKVIDSLSNTNTDYP